MAPQRILIVEDEKPMAHALSLKLRSVGFKVTLVYDGASAIFAIQKSKYDLIILDLILPKKNGFAILKTLKKLKITTPVIVSTNLSQKEDIDQARELGVRDYFIKSDTTLTEIAEKAKKAML